MTRHQRQRRPLAKAVAAFSVALALAMAAIAAPPAAGQDSPEIGFTEGRWIGSFNYLGTQELGGVAVRYRATGTFELVSSDDGTTGLWDLSLVSLIDGGVTNAIAGGSSEGEGIAEVTLELDSVTARDARTGLEITLSGDEIPDSGAGFLVADSTQCNALSGVWEIPFTPALLTGAFIANRTVGEGAGTAWQRFQQSGLDLLIRIDEGEVPIEAIRAYLQDAESVMGDTTERNETCDEDTFNRFKTASLALGDAMLGALASRLEDLSDDELVEVTRMGWRTDAFSNPDLSFPYEAAIDMRIGEALGKDDLEAMEYWLPVARETGRNRIAELLETAIEQARR